MEPITKAEKLVGMLKALREATESQNFNNGDSNNAKNPLNSIKNPLNSSYINRIGKNILRLLQKSENGINMGEITERLAISKSAVSQQVSRLEKSGLVKRKWVLCDRRKILVNLTEKGKTFLAILHQSMLAVVSQKLSILSDKEQDTLIALIEKISNQN